MFKIAIATAAAIRIASEKELTAKEMFDDCNTDKNGVLDAKEVQACMVKHKITNVALQKVIGTAILKRAFIPKSNWGAVAKGISTHT